MLKEKQEANAGKKRHGAVMAGVPFIVSIIIFSGILFLILSPFEIHLQTFEAHLVQKILNAIGTSTRATENPTQFFAENYLVEVSPLCSGLLELILLIAAVVATPDATWKKKIKGIILGGGLLFVFNLLRMTISIQQLIHTSLEFAEFTHGVLFRAVLILGFALIYGVWVHSPRIKMWASQKGI